MILAKLEGDRAIARFGRMRTYQTFSVHPSIPGDRFVVAQSSKSIVRVDLTTGKGLWNPKGSRLSDLISESGAVEVDLPEEFVNDVRALAGMKKG